MKREEVLLLILGIVIFLFGCLVGYQDGYRLGRKQELMDMSDKYFSIWDSNHEK